VAGLDGGAEEVFETLGKQMDSAAEAAFLLHVDQLDVREGQVADATGEGEEMVGLRTGD
jgi:hypothetical protein